MNVKIKLIFLGLILSMAMIINVIFIFHGFIAGNAVQQYVADLSILFLLFSSLLIAYCLLVRDTAEGAKLKLNKDEYLFDAKQRLKYSNIVCELDSVQSDKDDHCYE